LGDPPSRLTQDASGCDLFFGDVTHTCVRCVNDSHGRFHGILLRGMLAEIVRLGLACHFASDY
jgi:hypothetical protein